MRCSIFGRRVHIPWDIALSRSNVVIAGLGINFNLFILRSFSSGIDEVSAGQAAQITIRGDIKKPGPMFYLCLEFGWKTQTNKFRFSNTPMSLPHISGIYILDILCQYFLEKNF